MNYLAGKDIPQFLELIPPKEISELVEKSQKSREEIIAKRVARRDKHNPFDSDDSAETYGTDSDPTSPEDTSSKNRTVRKKLKRGASQKSNGNNSGPGKRRKLRMDLTKGKGPPNGELVAIASRKADPDIDAMNDNTIARKWQVKQALRTLEQRRLCDIVEKMIDHDAATFRWLANIVLVPENDVVRPETKESDSNDAVPTALVAHPDPDFAAMGMLVDKQEAHNAAQAGQRRAKFDSFKASHGDKQAYASDSEETSASETSAVNGSAFSSGQKRPNTAAGRNSANETSSRKRLKTSERVRWSNCQQCIKEFDVTQNHGTACRWHPGELECDEKTAELFGDDDDWSPEDEDPGIVNEAG
ncbi:hypothetical protein MMC25_001733 [Agyrium rufum]|nr:hypothetical protein [Agyrium rufum]